MRHLRIVLTLGLALLLLGSGTWLPGSRSASADSPPPAGLTAVEWQAIQSQVAKLTAVDGAGEDHFGISVSVSGDTAVVGANLADVGANVEQGVAYVFYRNQDRAAGSLAGLPVPVPDTTGRTEQQWGLVAKLTAADGAATDQFGTSVSVSGDTAVIGSPYADVGDNPLQGAAYVFYRDEGGTDAWGQVAKLTAADGAVFDLLGRSVSVDGEAAVVGAWQADAGGNQDQGAAYVFHRDLGGSDAWGQAAKLTAADGAAGDYFGVSVSLSGEAAVVGANHAAVSGNPSCGAAYVFHRDLGGSDAWGQAAKLTAADGAAYDYFGVSVSVSGDTTIVGAQYAWVGGVMGKGAAYVYYRDLGGSDAWGQAAKLTAADGAGEDYFGCSVSVDGDTAVVGADGADPGGNTDQGAAYVFHRNQGSPDAWGQVSKLTAADGAANDYLGRSVSVSGATTVAGADGADVGGNAGQGAAYVYSLPTLHLNALLLRWTTGTSPGTYRVAATVRVHDEDHAAAPGATVAGRWTSPNGGMGNQTKVTGANGVATLVVPTNLTGIWRFCVTNLTKSGYLYNPAANERPACKIILVGP